MTSTRRGLLGGMAAAGVSSLVPAPVRAGAARTETAAPGTLSFPPIDVARIAKRVVGATQPAKGEKAILVYDPAYYPDLAQAFEAELLNAGVFPVVALAFEPPEIVDALDALPGAEKRQEQFVALLQPVFQSADLFYWLPARAIVGDTRLEHLLDASRARGVHFHWVFTPAMKSAEDIAAASRVYARAILETDYAALSRRQDRLVSSLRGRTLRITTPAGTDLRLRVPDDAWFHKNDGDMSPARARQARGVRDREMEFPAGVVRCIPDASSVAGRLVLRKVPTEKGIAEGVTLDFEDGRVRRSSAARNEAALRAMWEAIGGDIGRVGEIVIGTNPLLVEKLPSGDLPYFGYGEGYVRVSLGDNWESGGALRCPLNTNLWLFPEDAALQADGTAVIQNGKILV